MTNVGGSFALGPGLTLGWTIGGPRGEAHNNRMHAELPSAVFRYPMRHLRQPGDAGTLFATAAMSDLQIRRFNGTERFVIGSAKCFTVGSGDDLTLWFEIETVADSAQPCSDTADNPATPSAELGISIPDFNIDDFVGHEFDHAGTENDDEDSCMSLFYYYEHQPLRNNHVTVLSRSGDRTFRIRWTARTQDVNYCDGSKPDAQVEIECDFDVRP